VKERNLKPYKHGTITIYYSPWCPQAVGVAKRRIYGETVIDDEFVPRREPFRFIRRCKMGRTTEYQVWVQSDGEPDRIENAFRTLDSAMRWCAQRWRVQRWWAE
jgi:hypothetical protein